MSSWHPGIRDSLAPPGFRPPKPIPSSPIYQLRHPTRYRWRKNIKPLIRHLYRQMGSERVDGPDVIHINTYLDHPEGYHRTLTSFDVWGPGGRNDPIGFETGQKAFNLIWHDPGEPYIDWIIWRRTIRVRSEGFVPRPFGTVPFEFHDDHIHVTFI